MLILKDLLLWALVLVHVVGAAFLFRRLLPRESRWLAFLLPEIAFVLLGNFVEHEIALTHLRLFLPLTTMGSVLAILWPGSPWRTMRLPSLLFVSAFTFTLGLRFFWPSIAAAFVLTSAGDFTTRTPPLPDGSFLKWPLPRPPAWICDFTT